MTAKQACGADEYAYFQTGAEAEKDPLENRVSGLLFDPVVARVGSDPPLEGPGKDEAVGIADTFGDDIELVR